VQEAAAILEVPPGTIKSRCSRGRARLAVLLADLARSPGTDASPGTDPGSDASHLEDPGRVPGRRTGHPPGRSDETHQEVSGHE
jgi:RNA polymerase sigma-70 factor (ECF subfamily)